ncbi:HAD-IC family P-type ATPase [Candidatus Uhrbacteria bacterium]|nr:HAD-IC family P-type ATPase [Candidatus Uhrbacteria bacterium]
MHPHALSIDDVRRELGVTPHGLTPEAAIARRAEVGPNSIPEKKKASALVQFLKQFANALVLILILASIISFVFGSPNDALVIVAIILVNAGIGFVQERRAERAIEALKKLVVVTATVVRGGSLIKIPAEELVPGDLIVLEEGDRIPADARVTEERDLRTDESSLTGESTPISKDASPLPTETALADRLNMVWLGTLVVGGAGQALVTATGRRTALGEIAADVAGIKEKKTHFRRRTDELAWTMAGIAIAGALIAFGIGFFVRHLPLLDIFLFSIASLVSGIPEGLPAILTIVLATGAYRMARQRAIVRHLPSTETLAVTTVIATDKTGTLTANTMTVRRVLLGDGASYDVTGLGWNPVGDFLDGERAVPPAEIPALARLVHAAGTGVAARIYRTDGDHEIFGDPTEAALVVLAEKAGLSQQHLAEEVRVLTDLPFERARKLRGRLLERADSHELVVIGAFERVIELASHVLHRDGSRHALGDEKRSALTATGEAMASGALRVLGIAYREFPKTVNAASLEDAAGLTLIGLVGMIDPPRPEVKEAVKKARRAGIRILMKTGDHKKTAVAIAKEVGLVTEAAPTVLTETELVAMSDAQFAHAVHTVSIFARVSPQTKLRICRELQRQGEVVAVTGDGVNDAPALRQADIGIAMGKIGTDVAREASDFILADDNFATIVNAIEEGRTVFRNVQQTSFYLVTTNIAEDVAIVGALVLGLPLPLLPTHLLWMNIVTDGLPDLALASEPKHHDVLERPPQKTSERILSKKLIPFLALTVLVMTAGTIFLFGRALPEGIEKARTLAFAFMAWAQLWNAWNMRSLDRSIFQIGILTNRFLVDAFLVAIALQLLVIHLPFFQAVFHFEPLGVGEWFTIIALSSFVLWFGELYKYLRRLHGVRPPALARG